MRNLAIKHVILVLVAASLLGCATMAPRSPEETALAIPVRLQRETVDEIYGEFRLRVERPDDPAFERVGALSFGNSYHLLKGLAAGKYVLAELSYWHPNANAASWKFAPEIPVELPAGTLTILPFSFTFRVYHDRSSNMLMLSVNFEEMTESLAGSILSHLSGRKGYAEWTMNPASARQPAVKAALEKLES